MDLVIWFSASSSLSSSQVLLSAVLDVELVSPTTVVPKGTTIAVRHFLSVPSCQEVKEAIQDRGNCHSIMKVTRGLKNKLDFEVIHSEGNITSSYISTDMFQNKSLCQILVAWVPWGNEKAECLHPSLKEITITKHKDVCGHQPNVLTVYCHCEAAEGDFKQRIEKRCHEPTEVVMVQDIEKKVGVTYNIVIRLAGSEEKEERTVSHLMLCKNNGVLQLGEAIHTRFDCTCKDPHCDDTQEIRIAAIKSTTGEISKYSNILLCDMSKKKENIKPSFSLNHIHQAPTASADTKGLFGNKLTLTQIMEEEIPKPHRTGCFFYINRECSFIFLFRLCT